MPTYSNHKNEYRPFRKGENLPVVSVALDSVRAYQFEIQFFGLPASLNSNQKDLTLAAKKVSPIGYSVEDIPVHRVNDTVYYPGRPQFESLNVEFDNLYLRSTSKTLWEWFKSIYDPISGDMTKLAAPGTPGNRTFKANKLRVIELDNTRNPHAAFELYGVYPKSVQFSEKNYSTNEFATISVDFRFDFMDHFSL
jgi:hypothetical protein